MIRSSGTSSTSAIFVKLRLSVFQIGNVTLSDLCLMRDVELRFTAPLAEHAQRILAASDVTVLRAMLQSAAL
jgi:hypothetical protein